MSVAANEGVFRRIKAPCQLYLIDESSLRVEVGRKGALRGAWIDRVDSAVGTRAT